MTEILSKKVKFYGRVQGVNFRRQTKDLADRFQVKGWIQNLPDGSVESVFMGDSDSVYKLLQECLHGLRHAEVESYTMEDYEGEPPEGFKIL